VGGAVIAQNRLSSPAEDERERFGASAPVDVYRLTTLDPALAAYPLDQYGEYEITLSGELEDVWGNRYSGGGTYRVLIAEPLDVTPGVLPGTPFVVGDAFYAGARIAPGVPAEISVRVRVFPLDGGFTIETIYEGLANAAGYFSPQDAPVRFDTPGEYVIDYEARYTDEDGRLWAASLRSAGVIASPQSNLIARGQRGLPGVANGFRPAWFELERYAAAIASAADTEFLNLPYASGDVARIGAGSDSGISPMLHLHDLDGAYTAAVLNRFPQWSSRQQIAIGQLAREDELPILAAEVDSSGYFYFSAVRPGVTVRQFASAGSDGGVPLGWDADDPHNGQIGAGNAGLQTGDYAFLFGGAVLRGAGLSETSGYASLLVVGDDADEAHVVPPGRSVLTVSDQPYTMFFHPTGVQPGDVLRPGDTLALAGQVAPPLAAEVRAMITSPSGVERTVTGRANALGYYFDPDSSFPVDEIGVWSVEIEASYAGMTSTGVLDPPIRGGVLGAGGGRFSVYVVPADASLDWSAGLRDTTIPVATQFNFTFAFPDDWTDVRAFRTLTIPGYILEDGEVRAFGRSFTYTLNPSVLSGAFPNLEDDSRVHGAAGSDTRTLTIAITGVDASGTPRILSRTFTLLHDRLVSLGQ
jgi:hypothetical protein